MFCSKCGFETQNGSAFCTSCGSKIEPPQQKGPPSAYPDQWPYGYNQASITPPPPAPPTPEVAAAESMAIASLVMGILSMTILFIVGIILGALAISRGKSARTALNDHKNPKFWIALAGVITGSVGLAFSIFFTVYFSIMIILMVALGINFGF